VPPLAEAGSPGNATAAVGSDLQGRDDLKTPSTPQPLQPPTAADLLEGSLIQPGEALMTPLRGYVLLWLRNQ
jgi:hypothetical protein